MEAALSHGLEVSGMTRTLSLAKELVPLSEESMVEPWNSGGWKSAASLADFVCATLALVCNRDRCDVSLETPMLELDVDSLAMVSMLAQVEAAYGLEIEPDDVLAALQAAAVSDLVDYLSRLLVRGPQE